MADRVGPVVVICAIDPDGKIKALELDANDYLKVMLASADGSDLLTELALKLNTADLNIEAVSKDLQVDVKASGLPTGAATQTTLAALLTELLLKPKTSELELVSKALSTGSHGWYSAAWRRNPVPFGFSGVIAYNFDKTDLPAGSDYYWNATVVPANTLYVLTSFLYKVVSTTITKIDVLIKLGGVGSEIAQTLNPTSALFYSLQGWYVLGPGDTIGCAVYTATLNDDVHLRTIGFKVDLNE